MRQIRITEISGATYPINVTISDINGNYQTLIGTITGAEEPNPPYTSVNFTTQIPSIFNTAPAILLTLEDSNGCIVIKQLDCTFGCYFEIVLELANCNFNLTLT